MAAWWDGLDSVRKSLVAAAALVVMGAVLGTSPLGAIPGRVAGLEHRVSAVEQKNVRQDSLPGRVLSLETRMAMTEQHNVRQDSLLDELADGRRFNTCLGLSSIRGYDPALCEEVLPHPERFIPLGRARRTR